VSAFIGTLSDVYSVTGRGTVLQGSEWTGDVSIGMSIRVSDLNMRVIGIGHDACGGLSGGELTPLFTLLVDCREIDQLKLLIGELVYQIPEAALEAPTPQVPSSGLSRGPRVQPIEAVAGGTLGPRRKAWDDTSGEEPSEAIGHFRTDTPRSQAQRDLVRLFKDAGIESPELDARWLMIGVLGISEIDLINRPNKHLGEGAVALSDAATRRLAGEPVSRILGNAEFYGREFALSPATLDPRADTETLIDEVLRIADVEGGRQRPMRILDLGTGTGCILLTLLAELPQATGIGCDISAEAIATANRNAHQLGVAARCELRVADMLSPGFGGIAGPFDLIISNPPYIETAVIAGLDRHVRDFDPMAALDGGADGLVFYRAIAAGFAKLVPDGWLVLEIGFDQAALVAQLLETDRKGTDWSAATVQHDLGGNARCVSIRTRDIAACEKPL
jgi:release factor glutamine methyltransferase